MATAAPKRTVLVVVNDLHVGSPFAVAPARWLLHDGNSFEPNELQRLILAHWAMCWQNVAKLRKGARLIVVVLGDVIEGVHHETTQVVTTRLDTQEAMAAAVIESGLQLAQWRNRGDVLRFVTGTPAHDGLGYQSAERVARAVLDLGYNASQRSTTDVLRLSVNGTRFDFTHKPGSGPGSRAHTLGNAFGGWLRSLYFAALEEQQPPPRYVLTAHFHNYLRREVYATRGHVAMTGYICPSWKVADEYVMRVAPFAVANVGMLAFDVAPDGATQEHLWLLPVQQNDVEEL
jgi:hypothetical protein